MATLTIHFRGLTALVRISDEKWRAILVNAMAPTVSSVNTACVIEPHYPYIAFPLSQVDEETAQNAMMIIRPATHDGLAEDSSAEMHAVWLLPNHEVSLQLDTQQTLSANMTTLAGLVPSDQDKGSLRWLFDMPSIVPGAATVRADVLGDAPPTSIVAGFVDLNAGVLEVPTFSGSRYSFLNLADPVARAMSFEATVRVEVTSPPTVMIKNRIDDGGDHEIILAGNGDFEIIIDNAALSEIANIESRTGLPLNLFGQPYYDFELMYRLSAAHLDKIVLPVSPVTRALDPPFARCIPAALMTA